MATQTATSPDHRPLVRLSRIVIAALLISTAVPKVFGPLREPTLSHRVEFLDTWLNVAFYVPLGVVLSTHSRFRAVAVAAAVSITAELVQLFLPLRSSQVADVFANVAGAFAGHTLGQYLRWRFVSIRLGAASAAVLVAGVTVYLLGCPEVCSDVYSWRIGIARYRDVSVLGGGALNAIVQVLFIECHNGPVPNSLLVGMALAAAAVGLWPTGSPKITVSLCLLGGLVGGLVVRFRPDTLGMTVASGLLAGVVLFLCFERAHPSPPHL